MRTPVSAHLATEVVDLSSIPLYELRIMHGSMIDHAVQELTVRVRNGECVESVQGQRD
jgi:transcription elongation GreA/GreB family factor